MVANYVFAHDSTMFYNNAAGVQWTAAYIAGEGDPITDLSEVIAVKVKA